MPRKHNTLIRLHGGQVARLELSSPGILTCVTRGCQDLGSAFPRHRIGCPLLSRAPTALTAGEAGELPKGVTALVSQGEAEGRDYYRRTRAEPMSLESGTIQRRDQSPLMPAVDPADRPQMGLSPASTEKACRGLRLWQAGGRLATPMRPVAGRRIPTRGSARTVQATPPAASPTRNQGVGMAIIETTGLHPPRPVDGP